MNNSFETSGVPYPTVGVNSKPTGGYGEKKLAGKSSCNAGVTYLRMRAVLTTKKQVIRYEWTRRLAYLSNRCQMWGTGWIKSLLFSITLFR